MRQGIEQQRRGRRPGGAENSRENRLPIFPPEIVPVANGREPAEIGCGANTAKIVVSAEASFKALLNQAAEDFCLGSDRISIIELVKLLPIGGAETTFQRAQIKAGAAEATMAGMKQAA